MIGIFADVPNVFFNCKKRLNGRLDYEKLYKLIEEREGKITRAFAYGFQIESEATPFIHCLKHIGFDCKWQTLHSYEKDGETKYRHVDLGVAIALDVVRNVGRLNTLVLVSSDPSLSPLVRWAQENGLRVIIVGSRISSQLKDCANKWIEITSDLLEENHAPEEPE